MHPNETPDFTFEASFHIIPLKQGSYMINQGASFSQAFSSLGEVVQFLRFQKALYFQESITKGEYDGGRADYEATGRLYPNDYEPFDKTGLPKPPIKDPDSAE